MYFQDDFSAEMLCFKREDYWISNKGKRELPDSTNAKYILKTRFLCKLFKYSYKIIQECDYIARNFTSTKSKVFFKEIRENVKGLGVSLLFLWILEELNTPYQHNTFINYKKHP